MSLPGYITCRYEQLSQSIYYFIVKVRLPTSTYIAWMCTYYQPTKQIRLVNYQPLALMTDMFGFHGSWDGISLDKVDHVIEEHLKCLEQVPDESHLRALEGLIQFREAINNKTPLHKTEE